jgi:phosphate transport system protein
MKWIEEERKRLREELLEIHERAERAVKLCFKAMKGSREVVREISRIEEEVDELDARIHHDCSIFIMRFQPMASDLRFALGAMRIASAYERIVDLAQEVSLYECEFRESLLKAEEPLLEMFRVVEDALKDPSMGEEELKGKMIELDDKVDEAYINTMDEIEEDFRCIDEVLSARHIERVGDLLEKIATRIVYVREGKWVWIK